tara:strand:- start:186 stop:908 length:723 start_codon:yes stop_codon:yes gene_type:complete
LSAFTLATLRTAIDEWLENTSWGNPSQRDSLIVLAEEKINSLVGIAGFNTDTASASVAAGDNNITPIPESITSPLNPLYLKMRSQVGTEADNPWSFLLLKDYNFLQEYAPVNNVESQSAPKYYSFYSDVSNSNQATVNFAPYADASYSYEFNYYFEPASLTAGAVDGTGTTWLSTHAKNALMYGCILQGYIFMKGEQQIIQTYEMKFIEAIKALVAMQGGTFRDTSFNDSDNAPNMMVAQ